MINNAKSTSQVAREIGVSATKVLTALEQEGIIERTANRHYKATPFLVKSGVATSGDLRWTSAGQQMLRTAFSQ